jgi:Glycosyl hydrolases family 18
MRFAPTRFRRPRSTAPSSLRGVVALPERPAGVEGPCPVPSLVELGASDSGLIVTPSGDAAGGPAAVPSLVNWNEITRVSVDDCAEPPEDRGRVLEVGLGGEDLGNERALRFVAPAAGLGALITAMASALPSASVEFSTTEADAAAAAGGETALVARVTKRVRATFDGLRGDPEERRRAGAIAAGVAAILLVAGGATPAFLSTAGGTAPKHENVRNVGNAEAAADHPSANLPKATTAPAPAPPSLAGSAPLQSHEVFGYAPYWTLAQSSSFDFKDLTTLAYFSVDANGDGTLDESGAGWNGFESQDLVNLVNSAHSAGDRVVLTVTDFSQSSLDAITSDPSAPARLSSSLISAIQAKNLDGVNFDFEGEGSGDQAGLTSLVTQVSNALHTTNPHWQVTMATYASAAGDPSGFYNIAALAPVIDGFFVMAYDMNSRTVPSPTAPLVGGSFNDTEALQQFTAAVPPSKVILGVPYYGYDWPTTNGSSTAQATGGEAPLSDSVIASSGEPTYWDPSTQTAWTSYQVGDQWHETYFDDPTSLALKAQLANSYHVAGVGIWALGMDGNDPAMLAALLGNAPAAKDLQTGPNATAPSGPPGTGFSSTGVWNGATVPLTPIGTPAPGGSQQYLGTLTGFATTDPALACMQGGPPLNVWSFSTMPGVDVVAAAQPWDCTNALFAFTPPGVAPAGSPTTTTSPPSSSSPTTTQPPTTTTTTHPPSTTTTTSTSTTTTTTTPSSLVTSTTASTAPTTTTTQSSQATSTSASTSTSTTTSSGGT